MTITFEKAKRIAKARQPQGCVLQTEIEKPYGWYFSFETRQYIKTGDDVYKLLDGGFIVDKVHGHIFEFPTAYSLEENFRRHELGFRWKNTYDLTVTHIHNVDLAVYYLSRLSMRNEPAKIGIFARIWLGTRKLLGYHRKISAAFYTQQQIRERLNRLPCVFRRQRLYIRVDVLEMMQKTKCLTYSVTEHKAKFA